MVLDPTSCNSVPFLVEPAPPGSTTTNPVLPSISNLFSGTPINAGPLPPIASTSQCSNILSSTGSQPTNDVPESSPFMTPPTLTTSSVMASQVRTIFHCLCSINDIGSIPSSLPSRASFTLHLL